MKDDHQVKNDLKIRMRSILTIILLLHSFFCLIYWLSIGDLKRDVNHFIAVYTGLTLPYTTILIIVASGIGVWSLIRLISIRMTSKKDKWKTSTADVIYLIIWVTFLALFYLSFVLILRENPSQRGVLIQLLNLIRLGTDPILFLMTAIWLRRLILFLRKRTIHSETPWPWRVSIGFVLLLLVGLWLLPAIWPPNWAYQGDLPAKPALIAHRGASMLAPENTLAAAELAHDYDAFGFETDVRISLDGVPFLMHDETLQRTTNIIEIYPDRVAENASNFLIDELRALNAGLWFIQKDPYNTIESGLVSQAQLSINQGQKIPALKQALELVDQEKMVILFDLRYPPQDHPYYERFFEIVFKECQESGLNGELWFLVDRENLETVLEEAPQMTRVIGVSSTDLPDPEKLMDLNYEIVNVDLGIIKEEICAYRQKGLGVNVYTVDQPWLFSQFWLSGVTSITTNNVHTLSQMDQPNLNLPYSRFLLFWGLFGIVLAIWIASSQPKRECDSERSEKLEPPDLMDFALREDLKGKESAKAVDSFGKDSDSST